jgi:hypothetical protein
MSQLIKRKRKKKEEKKTGFEHTKEIFETFSIIA